VLSPRLELGISRVSGGRINQLSHESAFSLRSLQRGGPRLSMYELSPARSPWHVSRSFPTPHCALAATKTGLTAAHLHILLCSGTTPCMAAWAMAEIKPRPLARSAVLHGLVGCVLPLPPAAHRAKAIARQILAALFLP
jgi:hypothetical protein